MSAEADKIPSPLIGILGEIFNEFYTHAEINRVFTYADAPGDPPDGNKIQKTVGWLRRVACACDRSNRIAAFAPPIPLAIFPSGPV